MPKRRTTKKTIRTLIMNQLQIQATIIDIENKTDKNSNPYYRLSLQGMPGRYFYAFSFSLPSET